MNRSDFPMLEGDRILYFDNGATTFKPKCVIDKMVDYYSNYTANCHRGDYDASLKVDIQYEGVRDIVKNFIHASSSREVVFTRGTTDSLNMVVFGFMKYHLQEGDEVLLTKAEHASNVLPWLALAKEIGIVIRYMDLDSDHHLTMDAVLKSITPKTKVISIAHVTNVVGDTRPVFEIGELCHEKGIYFVVDGAQSVLHIPTDVVKNHIDFFAFSSHKMLGPTGVGVLYARMDLLKEMHPISFGGGMNAYFEADGSYDFKEVPTCFEAGTPPIAEVIGLGEAILYVQSIGVEKIHDHEVSLQQYLMKELDQLPHILVYNRNTVGSIVAFNIKDVFSQDTAVYLNHYHICVRAGNHCAKILKDEFKIKNTCRVSFGPYNTKEEVDELIRVLKNSEAIFKVII